jgi:hypothetical protein
LKRIYKIDISQATDVSDPDDSPNGKRINGKTLEQLSDASPKKRASFLSPRSS